MDEDYILGLLVFLGLAICGISVLWAAWKKQEREETGEVYYDTV